MEGVDKANAWQARGNQIRRRLCFSSKSFGEHGLTFMFGCAIGSGLRRVQHANIPRPPRTIHAPPTPRFVSWSLSNSALRVSLPRPALAPHSSPDILTTTLIRSPPARVQSHDSIPHTRNRGTSSPQTLPPHLQLRPPLPRTIRPSNYCALRLEDTSPASAASCGLDRHSAAQSFDRSRTKGKDHASRPAGLSARQE